MKLPTLSRTQVRTPEISSLLLLAAAVSMSGCDKTAEPQTATQKTGSSPSPAPSSPSPGASTSPSSSNPVTTSAAKTYQTFRDMAFANRVPANHHSRISSDPSVHAFIVDWTISKDATATLVCSADGSAGICTSTGGGFLGKGEHKQVREAAAILLQIACESRDQLSPISSPSIPSVKEMRFTLITSEGLLSCLANVDELRKPGHPLSKLANQVQVVIAAIRAASGPNRQT